MPAYLWESIFPIRPFMFGVPNSTKAPWHSPTSTTDKQIVTNGISGGVNLQLGSTAGVDTNDPVQTGSGLVFTTDDYCLTPTIPGLNMAGDLTMFAVALAAEAADISHR